MIVLCIACGQPLDPRPNIAGEEHRCLDFLPVVSVFEVPVVGQPTMREWHERIFLGDSRLLDFD